MRIKYIKNSVRILQEKHKNNYIHNIPVHVVNPFVRNINLNNVITQVEKLIPLHLLKNIDVVYVANMKDFNKKGRTFNAMYKEGAIYISPDQDNEADLLDDIVHEIAHSFEKEFYDIIYSDGSLEREFLAKRRTLHYLIDIPTLDMLYYSNTEYNAKFDDHLYNDIGYDKMRILSAELFYSPYAITSLREYWANGFENFMLGDKILLKEISPVLYGKILSVLRWEEQSDIT